MKAKKKKVPGDYPILRFTTTTDVHDEIMHKIESIVKFHNDNLKEDEYRFRNNDVAIEALRIGLKSLEKKVK